MAKKTKTKQKIETTQEQVTQTQETEEQNKVGFPNVTPPSRLARNQAKPPSTLRVCGNTIPVNDGKASEADPRKIRARKREFLKKRGLKEDEERI